MVDARAELWGVGSTTVVGDESGAPLADGGFGAPDGIDDDIRLGGCSVHPGLMKTYRPRWIDTVCACGGAALGFPVAGSTTGFPLPVDEGAGGAAACCRTRSPRMITSCWITDFPARIMCCVAWSCARREILLPFSWIVLGSFWWDGDGGGCWGLRDKGMVYRFNVFPCSAGLGWHV